MPSALKIQDNMTELVLDTFLESHLTDTPVAGTWVVNATGFLKVLSLTDELSSDGTNTRRIGEVNFSVGTDQMIVSCSALTNFQANTRKVGVMGRMSSGGFTNGYELLAEGGNTSGNKNNSYLFNSLIAGVRVNLITWTDTANSNGDSYHSMKMYLMDPLKTIEIDGINRGTTTDNNLTGNFYAGVQMQNADPRLRFLIVEDSTGLTAAAPLYDQSFAFIMA